MMVGPGALLALCSLLFSAVQGALVNRTIDDWFGDSESGTRPVFLPTGTTWKDEQCTDCAINPDTTRAFRSTYNAATAGKGNDPVTMTMDFEGTAIYVFFILFNDQGDGITTETQARFSIDGGSSTTFSHEPDSTRNILFNQLVFSRTGLSNGRHTLRMEAGGLTDRDIYVNFDYAIYSFDDAASDPPPSSSITPPSSSRDPTSSSSSSSSSQQSSSSRSDPTSSGPTSSITPGPSLSFSGILPPSSSSTSGISGDGTSGDSRGEDSQSSGTSIGGIVGGVVGGLAALGLLAFLLLCFLRRRKRERSNVNGPLHLEDQGFPPPQPPPMQSRNQATYSQAFNAVGYGNPTENPFMPAQTQGQGDFHQTYSASGYGSVAPVAAGYAGSQAYAGSQSTEYNPYNAPAVGHSLPASNTEGSVYSSPYGGIANMGSQSSRSQDPSSDFSHRRLVALNPDQNSPLVVAGLTQQDQIRRARQEELDRQMATVQSEMHELDRDLKRGTSVRRRTIPRNAEVEERDMTIEEMQQQMEMMRQQIDILRENQRSDWAAGLTNDPPPGYTADPVQWAAAARSPVPPLPTHAIPVTGS